MKRFRKTLLAAALYSAVAPASLSQAEDIHIYSSDVGASAKPNILVIIDNSANWASAAQHWPGGIKQGESELNALRTVIGDLSDRVNLGLMMFTSGSGTNKDGGYVRYHIRPMNDTNRSAFRAMLGNPTGCTDGPNSLNGTPDCIYQNFASGPLNESISSASTDYSAAMFEVFKYFGGYTSPAHADDNVAGSPVDTSHFGATRYAGNPDSRTDQAAFTDAAPTKTNYNTPLDTVSSCAKNFVIFIGNGFPSQDSAATLLSGVGGDTTALSAPDYVTTTGTVTTLLGSGAYASQAECEAAALATYGTSYDSYSCANPAPTTVSYTLNANTGCGVYESEAACAAAAATTFPGYTSYSCTANTGVSCTGATINLGLTTCGQYSSVAACESGSLASHPSFSSVTCAVDNPACNASTVSFGTSVCGEFATATACEAALAGRYPGYSNYSCTFSSSCTTTFSSTACYALASACASDALAANPGYNSFTCSGGSNAGCNGIVRVCGDANTYNNTTDCTSGGNTLLPGYSSYSCASTSTTACGTGNNREWTITGVSSNQAYSSIIGSGKRWGMFGTTAGGATYSMTGHGGNSYRVLGHATTTTYEMYGSKLVTTASPTGTFSTTSGNYADEWAHFLYQTDLGQATGQQNITTYAIDVFKDAQDPQETKLLMSMARAGGGKYFAASDEGAIRDALRRIMAEIQSVNSVFASSSLPVSVNTQGQYLNQVFMGMFRPDGTSKPRWAGNLKQYHLALFNNSLRLADKNDVEAISSTTGFITPCATSFWSTDTNAYWDYAGSVAKGSCLASTNSKWSDAPDGDVVEKGGAAQHLRGVIASGTSFSTSTNYATRALKTCNQATGCTALTNFDTSNTSFLTAAAFGILAGTENDFIDWVRGKDVDDEDNDTVLNEMRPSVHGGVIHSQPAVVDFGSPTGVVAFYGADDGAFHAVVGNKADTDGSELWSFIAPETFNRLWRLKDNGTTTPLVNFPTTPGSVAPKDYFFDGTIGVYQKAGNTWIYPAMRRGGRALYAFDVSTPSSPVLKWRRGCFTNDTRNDSNCSSGWTDIGQTWSKPMVTYLRNYVDAGNNPKPVLVFGGGYDTCEDYDGPNPYSHTDSTKTGYNPTNCNGTSVHKGAQIWFVDADSGTIIRVYPVSSSVPGDVALVENDSGYVTHVYAADINGDIYRINVGTYGTLTPSSGDSAFVDAGWSSNASFSSIEIADLADGGTAGSRKFLNAPSVVPYSGYNAVLIGSGDREHPMKNDYACGNFGGSQVQNMFFMVKDTPNAYPVTPYTLTNLLDVTGGNVTEADLASYQGWRFNFGDCEQSVNNPLTIGGTTYFGTNAPYNGAITSCTINLGAAKGYAVDFLTGNAKFGDSRWTNFLGGGMPPTPVGGIVDVGGVKYPFCIGCAHGPNASASQSTKIEINPSAARYRAFWYFMNDD